MTPLVLFALLPMLYGLWRLFIRVEDAERRVKELSLRLRALETASPAGTKLEPIAPKAAAEPAHSVPSIHEPIATTHIPPPLPAAAAPSRAPVPEATSAREKKTEAPVPSWDSSRMQTVPPATPNTPPPTPASTSPPLATEEPVLLGLTLEAFMGVKLFAWLGGLAMFLGVVFFVRYSFEHNLVTPEMRVTIGALFGLGLIGGGLFIPRPKFAVTGQTLCATGIVILYAVTYGSHAFYHFIGLGAAFPIMATITGAAFVLAVRLDAQVVAILGLLGGFLTPLLLATGQDNPAGLFTYLAVLDAGLVAVALRQRWRHLVTLAAAATAVMQLLWLATAFTPAKIGIATVVFLGFEVLFLLPFWICNRDDTGDSWTIGASGISAGMALAFAGYLLTFPELGERPWICLSILLAADAGLVVWPLRRNGLQGGTLLGGGAAFLLLNCWNFRYLEPPLLKWALGYFLIFAAFHTALPIALRRLRSAPTTVPRSAQFFPALGLLLMLWPALHIGASALLWIAVLVADLAAIILAALTFSLLGVVAALVLTLLAAGMWLAQTPVENPPLAGLLTVIAGFAALFCGASVFLQRRLRMPGTGQPTGSLERDALNQLPAFSAAVPFVLLISAVVRLHPANPSPIFGVGLLLVAVILALGRWSQTPSLPLVALACAALLEYCWQAEIEPAPQGWLPLGWYLGFTALIFGFPFLFQLRKAGQLVPWATAALAPVVHYSLFREILRNTWPDFWNSAGGLVPAALALPPLAACFHLRRSLRPENPVRLSVLAWFAGVTLFFVTLIFPTQFQHEWLTLSWVLEGVALFWLFHRLPHPGLRLVGFGLLCSTFVRLALNPAVLTYHSPDTSFLLNTDEMFDPTVLASHVHTGMPIWNWYLYTYGIAAAGLFVAAQLAARPKDGFGSTSFPGVFNSFGTILLFLLLNIEIADYFSTSSEAHPFDLARDMTYSIAWSLFALALLLVGMRRKVAPVRYAGIGLFVVTLVKLFLHDLANLDQLYRIGAFMIVAVVLIGASYLYQRFLAVDEKKSPPKDPPSNPDGAPESQ